MGGEELKRGPDFNRAERLSNWERLTPCGAGGIRTHVQTYSPNAFYMLILELIVRKRQGPNEPTVSVAEWS